MHDLLRAHDLARLEGLVQDGVGRTLTVLGLEVTPSSPEQMAKYVAAERAKWGQVIKTSGLKVD